MTSCEIIQFSVIAGLSKKDRKKIARAAGTSRASHAELEQEPERLSTSGDLNLNPKQTFAILKGKFRG